MKSLQLVHGVSERRTLRVLDWPRSTHRYVSGAKDQTALRMRIRDLALSRPRYGYRRLTVLLKREGWVVNHKRVYRLYSEDGLKVRVKRRKKLVSQKRDRPPAATRLNERWCVDFVADRMSDGRRYRVFTAIDAFSRESLALKVAWNLPASAVTRALNEVIVRRGRPRVITADNGSEFTSNHFDAWAFGHGVEIDFISPGCPVENAHIESFNGRLRDECLNSHWFESLDEARCVIEDWRCDYNAHRPHTSLGNLTPLEFAALQGVHDPPAERKRA